MFKKTSVDQSTFVGETPLNQSIGRVASSPAHAAGEQPLAQSSQTSNVSGTSDSSPSANTLGKDLEKAKAPRKPINIKIVLIAALIVLVLVLFIAVQIRNSSGQQLPVNPTATPSITQNDKVDRSPIQQRIDRLQDELELAAPIQQEFAFPPIDSEISITSK